MVCEPTCPPTLAGAESAAKIIKDWLVDQKKTRSGIIGVDDALQVVSVQTFPHSLTQPGLKSALGESLRASATGIVAYSVADGAGPFFDPVSARRLAASCEAINATLLDVIIYSPNVPKGWLSAREQGVI